MRRRRPRRAPDRRSRAVARDCPAAAGRRRPAAPPSEGVRHTHRRPARGGRSSTGPRTSRRCVPSRSKKAIGGAHDVDAHQTASAAPTTPLARLTASLSSQARRPGSSAGRRAAVHAVLDDAAADSRNDPCAGAPRRARCRRARPRSPPRRAAPSRVPPRRPQARRRAARARHRTTLAISPTSVTPPLSPRDEPPTRHEAARRARRSASRTPSPACRRRARRARRGRRRRAGVREAERAGDRTDETARGRSTPPAGACGGLRRRARPGVSRRAWRRGTARAAPRARANRTPRRDAMPRTTAPDGPCAGEPAQARSRAIPTTARSRRGGREGKRVAHRAFPGSRRRDRTRRRARPRPSKGARYGEPAPARASRPARPHDRSRACPPADARDGRGRGAREQRVGAQPHRRGGRRPAPDARDGGGRAHVAASSRMGVEQARDTPRLAIARQEDRAPRRLDGEHEAVVVARRAPRGARASGPSTTSRPQGPASSPSPSAASTIGRLPVAASARAHAASKRGGTTIVVDGDLVERRRHRARVVGVGVRDDREIERRGGQREERGEDDAIGRVASVAAARRRAARDARRWSRGAPPVRGRRRAASGARPRRRRGVAAGVESSTSSTSSADTDAERPRAGRRARGPTNAAR